MHPGYVPDKVISDVELVVLAREGEAGAFGMLVERHRATLYAAALAVLGDRDAAMDAVQEAFVVALTRLNSIRDPAAVGRWLRMVVRNCALMQIPARSPRDRRRQSGGLGQHARARAGP
jgi:DNA-directed RNA polymerase specialized sigma24 family protein